MHFPAACADRTLSGVLPCGARTFLRRAVRQRLSGPLPRGIIAHFRPRRHNADCISHARRHSVLGRPALGRTFSARSFAARRLSFRRTAGTLAFFRRARVFRRHRAPLPLRDLAARRLRLCERHDRRHRHCPYEREQRYITRCFHVYSSQSSAMILCDKYTTDRIFGIVDCPTIRIAVFCDFAFPHKKRGAARGGSSSHVAVFIRRFPSCPRRTLSCAGRVRSSPFCRCVRRLR